MGPFTLLRGVFKPLFAPPPLLLFASFLHEVTWAIVAPTPPIYDPEGE